MKKSTLKQIITVYVMTLDISGKRGHLQQAFSRYVFIIENYLSVLNIDELDNLIAQKRK